MRIPLSWIKEYIDLTLSPSEIANLLTMAGLEVDSYETVGASFSGVVVGHVLEAEKHPNADKLTVATVTDGEETYQVVCGAPNCRKGLKTAFAPLGATLKDGEKEFKIKKTKIRGIESNGMLCSGTELGLSSDAEGILELTEDLPNGVVLSTLYEDTIFDISLTPNLGHCASVIGVARELAAALNLPLRYPVTSLIGLQEATAESLQVQILDKEACPRYTCRVIKDVKVSPSPDWLKNRLEKCGIRSINNVVDVTNYVLLEMGHPLHAFDYTLIEGKRLIVKKAQEGESFETLDGKTRFLQTSNLMICDAQKSLSIAGIMGGMNSEVTNQTHHVALESAYFDPINIRKTSKQLGLQTDASKRFERGTDPNQLIISLDRATKLIQEVAGGTIQADVIDVKTKEFPEVLVNCRLSRINRLLGTLLSRGEVENIFKNLGFNARWDGEDSFAVRIPTYRVDIKEEIDLVEEVARLYGYDNIARKGSGYHSSQLPPAPMYVFEKEIQTRLIAEGLQELLTCDLIGPSLINIVQDHSMSPESIVSVLNPTSIEQSVLRTSLLPGLLQVVKYNIDHQNHHLGGFEIGKIHFKDGEIYKEQSVAAIILTGKSRPHHWDVKSQDYDFFDLKGMVENILSELGVSLPIFKNLGIDTFHSGRQASIFVNSLEIGSIGEIHPAIQRRLDVPQRLLFGEFNLHDLMQVAKRREKVESLTIYPGSERDWTFTISETIPFHSILEAIRIQKSHLLENVFLLDVYRSDKLGPGYQNLTLRFIYRDSSKTVAQEIVEAEHHRMMDEVIKRLGEALKS